MLTIETVRTHPYLDEDQAARLVELWTAAYPAMREILDTVIRAQRGAARPTVDIRQLERVRLELGQIDRGTYRVCTHGAPAFDATSAGYFVRDVLDVTSIGSLHAGSIYRLAAELADIAAADHERRRNTDWSARGTGSSRRAGAGIG